MKDLEIHFAAIEGELRRVSRVLVGVTGSAATLPEWDPTAYRLRDALHQINDGLQRAHYWLEMRNPK